MYEIAAGGLNGVHQDKRPAKAADMTLLMRSSMCNRNTNESFGCVPPQVICKVIDIGTDHWEIELVPNEF
ncbi:hypothetical protein BOTCAL_0125g00030 [Botryotinia calthae]|uniref:Uncharacterized protein n=1 Tax=Botryotinia calthae TaxID=38488 RepID=A0A4Y8D6B9_9HELO|nr:hypothetical protein BOTCAL_0125g00030 [Botryotinia calthae]